MDSEQLLCNGPTVSNVRSIPNNGHHQTGPVGPFRARSGRDPIRWIQIFIITLASEPSLDLLLAHDLFRINWFPLSGSCSNATKRMSPASVLAARFCRLAA